VTAGKKEVRSFSAASPKKELVRRKCHFADPSRKTSVPGKDGDTGKRQTGCYSAKKKNVAGGVSTPYGRSPSSVTDFVS